MPFPTTASTALQTLQIRINRETENDSEEFFNAVDYLIRRAELRLWRDLPDLVTWRHTLSTTLASGVASQSIIPDVAPCTILSIELSATDGRFLLSKEDTFVKAVARELADAMPRYYNRDGETTVVVAPKPDQAYNVEVEYSTLGTGIAAVTGLEGNWIFKNAGNLLFYACMIEAELFQKNDPTKWVTIYLDEAEKFGGVQNKEAYSEYRHRS